MSGLFAKSRHMDTIVLHPLYLGAARHFIDVPIVYGGGERTVTRKPGIRIGVPNLFRLAPARAPRYSIGTTGRSCARRYLGREARMQIMIAISDFTADNGGTLIVPGSHTWGDDRLPASSDAVPTETQGRRSSDLARLDVPRRRHERHRRPAPTGLTMALDAANVRQEEEHGT